MPVSSLDQAWHKDNQRRGLTIIVPLVDFTPENGPTQVKHEGMNTDFISCSSKMPALHLTQVLVSSHDKDWRSVAQAGGAKVVLAPVGAIAAYDSRTFHRGLGNRSKSGRPAIILCYDRIETPPPGHSSPYTSILDSYRAAGLSLLSAGWEAGASFVK